MTLDTNRIIELALQAGAAKFYPDRQSTNSDNYLVGAGFLQRFAALVQAEKIQPSVERASDCPADFVKSAPQRIWLGLCVDGLSEVDGVQFPRDHEGIYWAEDAFGDLNAPYIRADLAPSNGQNIDGLKGESK